MFCMLLEFCFAFSMHEHVLMQCQLLNDFENILFKFSDFIYNFISLANQNVWKLVDVFIPSISQN